MINTHKLRYTFFYLLFFYVLAQLIWWGFQLISTYRKSINDLNVLQYKIWMIIGEGTVFIFLLFIGFRFIYRSIKKEIQLARLESTFLLSVTHELKTPIASIRLMLDTLLKRKTDELQQKQLLHDAQQELLRLQNQIENILLTTRTLTSAMERKDEEISIEALLKEPITKINKWFPNSAIELNYPAEANILFDRELFSSMLVNLLENAIEHSESSTSIQVDIAKDSKWITIAIKDQGTGIQENIKPLITQRFFTYNKNEQSQVKGTGLGLYLVDSIVKLYQGKLSFLPNEPKGTCVKIEIPL
jgi:signal transduction histidine kinase